MVFLFAYIYFDIVFLFVYLYFDIYSLSTFTFMYSLPKHCTVLVLMIKP